MRLLRDQGPVVKVGHRGAPLAALENTLASISAAAEIGVDAVELDVVARPDGTLVLGHSLAELAPDAPSLDEALELVQQRQLGVQLDVKGGGYEHSIAAAVRERGLLERSLVSSFSPDTLKALAAAEPRLRRALTYPDDRYGIGEHRVVQPFVRPGLAALRHVLPLRLPRWLRRVDADAATLHWTVVSAAVVHRCHAVGVAVWVWTVDDQELAHRLDALGADAIITNDPGILAGWTGHRTTKDL